MICLDCAHLDLKRHPAHAKLGMGQCKVQMLSGVFQTITYERTCERYIAVPAGMAEARHAWWGKVSIRETT
jgi:hypothetical protein